MNNKDKLIKRNFQPKILAQYERIFNKTSDEILEDQFFKDLYILRSDLRELESILEELSPDDLLKLQNNIRNLFKKGVLIMKDMDPLRIENALDTLKVFLRIILQKKYNNFTSDVVHIISGLDNIDKIFMDFVISLETLIQKETSVILRTKALSLSLCTVCHGFNSNIISYFQYRDFFPSIIKYITDPSTFSTAFLAFLFLGVLANNKKFESQNLYQTRLSDFVDNNAMQLIIDIISRICIECKNEYIYLQNNESDNIWNITNLLTYFNDIFFTSNNHKSASLDTTIILSENGFSKLPSCKAAILLPIYDFINVNKAFCYIFITFKSPTNNSETESPFSQFISFTSYLLEYQSQSLRASYYARLALLIIHILIDDDGCFDSLVNDANSSIVYLCRQKHPFLPLIKTKRILLLAIFDALISSLDHNLKRNLDIEKYILQIRILLNIISSLEKRKCRLEYHWQEVWKFFMHFIMFLLANSEILKQNSHIEELVLISFNFISLCITRGENFLLEFKDFEDLIYKLVQNGDIIRNFIKIYKVNAASAKTILLISEYYENLLKKYKSHELSPKKVMAIIKEGYGKYRIYYSLQGNKRTGFP
ncbi:hypothetical protein PNEG_02677 [Pneumocystis murina B123]|uniref:Armadillo-like helical domain-containing protein n=1 Tax=Pneumocystis murina (strain B123) TaxID=1069680 RepID=M7PEK1_PNEMU|nr:hypothetical protein PNEG_02677 [Pneumocystis murina B123]EMR08894.1 hypothetical protein PNEG_02677 [Pneumocystis murina B123]